MDITIDVGGYKLNVRAGVVIIHNNKILLHRNVNSDHYAMIGGRVEIGENSEHTIKREVQEELGKETSQEITNIDKINPIIDTYEINSEDINYEEILQKDEYIVDIM